MTPLSTWRPAATGARWSLAVRDLGRAPTFATPRDLLRLDDECLLPTASLGKLFLLKAVAQRLVDDQGARALFLGQPTVVVADSGLWQHLAVDELPVPDLATLVAACSDNLAANALLEWVGLDHVRETAAGWVSGGSTLHDLFRDERGDDLPETVSTGCAADHLRVIEQIWAGADPVSAQLRAWCGRSLDLSMVGHAVGLDPLSHFHPEGADCLNKTGCDVGVRADVGVISLGERAVSYAAICSWDPARDAEQTPLVLADLHALGRAVVDHLRRPPTGP